jgi:DNA-directed RNA polymerase subunit RPC12/RpoP
MSTPDTTPADAAAPDPHGLLADTEYNSMREAQRNATRSGEVQAQPRCPAEGCASTNLSRKAGATAADPDHKVDTAYRCVACGCHFDSPAPSVVEEGVPQHQGCGRALHVRRVGEGVYRCHRCEETWWSLEGFGE